MKKKAIWFAMLAALIATPAFAADMAVKAPAATPAIDWTGVYIGADIGGIWAKQQEADTFDPVANAFDVQAPDFVSLSASSVIGGAYAGYNYQVRRADRQRRHYVFA